MRADVLASVPMRSELRFLALGCALAGCGDKGTSRASTTDSGSASSGGTSSNGGSAGVGSAGTAGAVDSGGSAGSASGGTGNNDGTGGAHATGGNGETGAEGGAGATGSTGGNGGTADSGSTSSACSTRTPPSPVPIRKASGPTAAISSATTPGTTRGSPDPRRLLVSQLDVVATEPSTTDVKTYPDVQMDFQAGGASTGSGVPISSFKSVSSTFAETVRTSGSTKTLTTYS